MRVSAFLSSLALFTFAGCGDGGGMISVSGQITLDGSPVEGATVTFTPDENTAAQGGFGRTGADGKYVISRSDEGQGLAAGTYKVTVTRFPSATPGDEAGLIDAPIRGDGGWPALYAHPDTTPLRAKIEPGAKPFDFHLKSEKKPPGTKP